MFCTQCGSENTLAMKFCGSCGAAMSGEQFASPAAAPAASDSKPVDAVSPDEYYEAAIGFKNTDYYLTRFQRFDAEGKTGATWHWPAFFLTFYWLLYRKMYLWAFIYFILPYALTVPAGILAASGGDGGAALVGIIYLLYLAATFFVPAMYANAWYYKHCQSLIKEVRRGQRNPAKQLAILSGRGGTGGAVIIVVVVLAVVAVIGILAAIAIPQYAEYTNRAKLVPVTHYAKAATTSVENYYYRNKAVPRSLEQAGLVLAQPSEVATASVDANGAVNVMLAQPPAMTGQLAGKTLIYSPSLDDEGRVVWSCGSNDIPQHALPKECRRTRQ